MSSTMHHVSWLVDASEKGEDRRIGLEGVLVEQDGEVPCDVRNVVNGFSCKMTA